VNELALFAGAGGGIIASELLGHRTVCAVEFNEYARNVLVARQNDGTFPPFPVWDDVRTFDGKPWRGIVDIVSGGFPCQDISVAGKGAGLDGERSGLWSEFARIIGEVRPRYAFIENSPMLVARGLDRVLCDLAAMGFNAEWCVLSAADVGAKHLRERVWILGYSNSYGQSVSAQHDEACGMPIMGDTDNDGQTAAEVSRDTKPRGDSGKTGAQQASESTRSGEQYAELADTASARLERKFWPINQGDGMRPADSGEEMANTASQRQSGQGEFINPSNSSQSRKRETGNVLDECFSRIWEVEPKLGRVADGVAYRSHRLTAIGNGQVPQCAAAAFRLLIDRIGH
jgi:DNA (cytosine-5)-methyltransferase 1